MSFQAYLDNIEEKTGKTPREFLRLAHDRGLDAPGTKAGAILDWLKTDFGLGRGHGMAIVHILQHGDGIDPKHVGTGGPHSDPSNRLNLDGKASRR